MDELSKLGDTYTDVETWLEFADLRIYFCSAVSVARPNKSALGSCEQALANFLFRSRPHGSKP